MAVQEDARVAARRIVEEVLASREPRTRASEPSSVDDRTASAAAAADAPVLVTDDVIVDLTREEPVAAVEPAASEERLRARALVAEVLEAHEARQAAAVAEAEARARAEVEAAEAGAREEEAARQRAEALAEEEARAAAEAEERERALAEERERDLWADADRESASETVQMQRQDDEADRASEATTPLGVAELAAAGRAASHPGDGAGEAGAPDDDAGPERTAVLPVQDDRVTGSDVDRTQLVAAPDGGATAVAAPAAGSSAMIAAADEAPEGSESPSAPALEATVDPADVAVDPPRTGRWLLASILGAVTLAILFPLAINALMDLVAMS